MQHLGRWIAVISITVVGGTSFLGYVGYQRMRHSQDPTIRRLIGRGWLAFRMTEADAARAEADLKDDPEDIAARRALIEFYEFAPYKDQALAARRPDFEEKREQHVLWFIGHHPEETSHEDLRVGPDKPHYAEAKALWLQQVD